MSQRSTGIAVMASMLIGFLLGLFAMYYIITTWVPGDVIYRDSTPGNLAYDGRNGHYRDFYVTNVAREYQRMLTAPGRQSAEGQKLALDRARTMLGVTTGDVSPALAADVVSSTLSVARIENDKQSNKDDGWFSLSDETAIARLSVDLNRVRAEPVTIVAQPRDTSIFAGDTLAGKLLRLLPLALLFIGAGLLLWFLFNAALGKVALPFLGGGGGARAPSQAGEPDVDEELYQGDDDPTAQDEGYQEPAPRPRSEPVTPPPQRAPVVELDPPVNASYGAAGTTRGGTVRATTRPGPMELTATQDEAQLPTLDTLAEAASASAATLGEARSLGTLEYTHGNEIFDEDFDVTNSKGMLIGTCGASIAERIGMTQPSQVNALLVSVFDKAAFKTTSKVLVAPSVIHNALLVRKLKEKGELVVARPGEEIVIDTHTLRVRCKVNAAEVTDDGEPANSFFRKVSLAFGSQQKHQA